MRVSSAQHSVGTGHWQHCERHDFLQPAHPPMAYNQSPTPARSPAISVATRKLFGEASGGRVLGGKYVCVGPSSCALGGGPDDQCAVHVRRSPHAHDTGECTSLC